VSGPADRLELRAGDARLTVDAEAGGRFASLEIDGHELLVTHGDGPIWWGCYPMAPFAGRIREGVLVFRGATHRLATNLPPHAIHGTVLERPWQVVSGGGTRAVLAIDLGPGWPFPGRVTQSVELAPDGLDAELTLEADAPMPAWLGWHPWFRRRIGDPRVVLAFEPTRMYVRGSDGMPTGEVIAPTPGRWDDAFGGVDRPPRLTWPGVMRLEIDSSAEFWVVYDERDDALCVEPQTAPPDAVNLAAAAGVEPPLAEPGRPVSVAMRWRWWREAG
jgi:aldose 1-epimerase